MRLTLFGPVRGDVRQVVAAQIVDSQRADDVIHR